MKIVRVDDGSFRTEMEASDADETAVNEALRDIELMLASIRQHGHSRAVRIKDRGGYYRYAEVERSLGLVRDAANRALLHIKFLDFPEQQSAGDPRDMQ